MRQFFAFVLIYLLFIIQAGTLPYGPDFVLLAVVLFALHEHQTVATFLGLFAGLLFDLLNPGTFGLQILCLSIIGYGVATLRSLFYRSRWQAVVFTFVGLLLKTGFESAAAIRPQLLTLILTFGFTLILCPFAESGLIRLFYKRTE